MTMPRLSKKVRRARAMDAIEEILDCQVADLTLEIYILTEFLADRLGELDNGLKRSAALGLVVTRCTEAIQESAEVDGGSAMLEDMLDESEENQAAEDQAAAELADGATTH
jgi:hypothetical protein